jgi:hypothetical protein
MKKLARTITLLLISGILFNGCSMLTAQGRRERAYERYVRKSSMGRIKQQKRYFAHASTIPALPPSDPVVSATSSGPESATSGSGE